MINFIIYEDEKSYRELYINEILKVIGKTKLSYKILEISKYDKNILNKVNSLIGKKIFILDIEVPGKSGLDFAQEIRKNGDWNSQVIIVSSHENLKNIALSGKLLIIDFISKYFNTSQELLECLTLALRILSKNKSLRFQYNGEVYQIPYNEILFIEKNSDNAYATVVTVNNRIIINKKISKIEELLKEDNRFFKTHQSCIVNLDKITKVYLKDNVIQFGKEATTLLTRDKKKELKEKILNYVE